MMRMTAKMMMALALVVLVLGDAALAVHHNKHHHQKSQRQQDQKLVKFESGHEYHFRYDAQTSTGYSSLEISRQRAINRLQANVKIIFQSPTEATLTMRQVRTAQLSEVPSVDAWNPAHLQPISAFENHVLPIEQDEQTDEMREFNAQLLLPVSFQYTEDGMIEAIRFKKSESIATKNIKKAVLNLLQVNLRPTKQETVEFNDDEGIENKKEISSRYLQNEGLNENRVGNTYTNVENTIEGQCEITYAISPNQWQKNGNQQEQKWNVTKSINFERCSALADVAYGYHTESFMFEQNTLHKSQQQDILTPNKLSSMNNEEQKRYGQVIPKERLERSTVLRYILTTPQNTESQNAKNLGIERVELLSKYTVQNNQLNSEQAMQTIAVAELVFLKSAERTSNIEQFEEKSEKKTKTKGFSRQSINNNEEEGPEETLLYNADFESLEKKFFMLGDEKYPEHSKLPISPLFIVDKSNNDIAEQGKKMLKNAERELNTAVRSYLKNQDENAEGINAPETAESLWNIVYIMRTCTVSGLKQLHERATAASKDQKSAAIARELFANALALAGTRNTIALLVEMIESRTIDELKATQILKALGSGAGLPAPSESQVDLVLRLCKSKSLESEALKRGCWLTFGTMVGELSQQSEKAKNLYDTESVAKTFELATAHKMDLYKQVLLDGLKKADEDNDSYANIIALKAIGNAGLTSTIDAVVRIVQDATIPHDIRLHAIDALRRICHRQPESLAQLKGFWKVQYGLLPVFQNVNDRSDIRMATAAMLITNAATINTPSRHALIDQIVFAMQNEENVDVVGFVSGVLEGLAKSPIYQHQKIAQHLRNSLKLVRFSNKNIKQTLQGSQYSRSASPCCSESRILSFLNFVSIYASNLGNTKYFSADPQSSQTKVVPSQMAIELDSFVDGHYQRNTLQMSVIQNNFDAVLKELLSQFSANKFDYEGQDDEQTNSQNTGFLSSAAKQINSLFRKLNIKDRNDMSQQSPKSAYAFITLRNNDVDVLVMPITAEDILSVLKAKSSAGNLQKLKSTFAHAIHRFSGSSSGALGYLQINAAIPISSKFARIPTSLGMPLKICQGALLFGSLQLKTEQSQQESEILAIQPNVNYVEQQYMRVWMVPSAGVSAGMAWYRAAELNLPIELEIKSAQAEDVLQQETIINFRLRQEKIRVLGLHTLPSIFISWKSDKQVIESNEIGNGIQFKNSFDQLDACIRTSVIEVPIRNEQLHQQQRELDTTIWRNEKISLPFHIYGIYHMPREWSIAEFSKITKVSENTLHVVFTPIEGETPRELKFTFNVDMYQSMSKSSRKEQQSESQPWNTIRNRLNEFYSKFESTFFSENNSRKFLNSENESDEEEQRVKKIDNNAQLNYGSALKLTHQYMEKNLAKSVSYKHSIKMTVETVGARRQLKAESEIYAICDSKFHACETSLQVTRSALLASERQPWTMEVQLQSIYPETVLNVQELESTTSAQKRHLKLFAHLQARWGVPTEKKDIKINLLGEPSEQMIRKAINADNQYQQRLREAKRRDQSEIRIQQIVSEQPIAPFIDQFHAFVEYQLGVVEQSYAQRLLEAIKTHYFWNTKSELNVQPFTQSQTQQIKATLRVDPLTHRHVNISLETPAQRLFIQSVELPFNYNLNLVSQRRESLHFHTSPNMMSRFFSKLTGRVSGQQSTNDESLKECTVGQTSDVGEQNTIRTFDGVVYSAPISKCYSVIAKDCTKVNREPVYAVLAKRYGSGNQKTVKVISQYGEFEIEPTSEGSQTIQISYNGKTYTLASATAEDLEELDRHGVAFNSNDQQQWVTIIVPTALLLEFDGRFTHIQLSAEFKNTQCGLCGHYDDKIEDEFRMNNNQLTNDIKEFHRSFSMQDDADCSSTDFNNFYAKNKFAVKNEKKNKSKKSGKFSQIAQSQNSESTEESTPVEQTVVYEYNQKLCFSIKPVAQCPKGWYSADISGEQDMLKRTKVQFTCVERSSIEARRLRNIVNQVGFVDMSDYSPSYSELMVLPELCIQY